MNEQTLQRLKQMKFQGMAIAFKTTLEDGRMTRMTADEIISFLLNRNGTIATTAALFGT